MDFAEAGLRRRPEKALLLIAYCLSQKVPIALIRASYDSPADFRDGTYQIET
jgi:hypothetical protein